MANSENNDMICEVLLDLAIFKLNHFSHPPSFPVPNSMLESDKVQHFYALAKQHGYEVISEPDEKEGFTKLTCSRFTGHGFTWK